MFEYRSGIQLSIKNLSGIASKIRIPQGTNVSKNQIYFLSSDHALNEFGFLYVALYITGNYARYYPDQWLTDVERATPLALGVEELIAQAEERVPLLALGELNRNYLIPD